MRELKIKNIEENLHHPENGKIIDLSLEELSLAEYQWLADTINKSSYIEKIILPRIGKNQLENIINILNRSTIKNSTLTTLDFDLSIFNGDIPEDISIANQQIQSRLQRNKKKSFAIYGGGNI